MGVSYNGSTAASKSACVGSIPTTPAEKSFDIGHLDFEILSGPIVPARTAESVQSVRYRLADDRLKCEIYRK